MWQVKNEIFYHVQNLDQPALKSPWKVADTMIIGENLNPYTYILEHGLSNHPKRDIWLQQNLAHFYKCTREAVFEEIRLHNFTNYPSRRNCLWVIENKQSSIDYWWNHFKSTSSYPDKLSLLKLKLSGEVFQASQNHLTSTLTPVNEIREQAFKYWMGQDAEKNSEILFTGTLEVLEIIK